jgi:crotonobetainyl-CoA:carnitine CoA-transferase CaiB-like acyl-CoA transferase
MSHAVLGMIQMPGFPINSIESNAREHATAPGLGEHTDETLRRFGLSESEIAALLRSTSMPAPREAISTSARTATEPAR